MSADTIPARLLAVADRDPSRAAYHERMHGRWVPTTYGTFAEEVIRAARALIGLGLKGGDSICILSFNRPEWVVADLACMAIGGVPAGIYETCSPEEIAYIVGHCQASVVVVDSMEQWQKLRVARESLPRLRKVIFTRGLNPIDDPMVLSWDAFLRSGAEVDEGLVLAAIDDLQDDRPATFIYTSGTTGPPKAVALSHRNLAWTAGVAHELVDLSPDDCSVSYLPLSHIAEQMFTIHAPITAGSQIYFAESPEALRDNLLDVQPTVVFGVPRVWEKLAAGVQVKLAGSSGAKRLLVSWAMGVARARVDARNRGQEPSGGLALQGKLADALVLSKLKPLIGMGRAKYCVSGAAPISKEVLEFLAGLDVTVLEVYGQSEGSGPTTFNRPGQTRFGTVGPPFPGVEVRIADDGEVLMRGPNVFLGYHRDEGATAETLVDGWLHSGDLGRLDSDGFLSIVGRKKEIIITSGGKNIAPKNIEAALTDLDLVTQAVVIGDRRKYLTALVAVDPAAVERRFGPLEDGVATDRRLREALQAEIERVNERFARVEHIRKFEILPRELDVEHGELTPTLKVKRRVVAEVWSDLIERMYGG